MNYQKIYNQIIERAKNRILEGYSERHHILPKSMGGSYCKYNIVKVTPKEHFICHMLLIKMYPSNNKLKYALWMMINGSGDRNRYNPSSQTYSYIKNIQSNVMRENRLGKNHTDETKLKMSLSQKGRILTEEHKNNISKKLKGRKASLKTIEAASKPKSITQIIKRVEKVNKPILQYDLKNNFIKEWKSCTEVRNVLGVSNSIQACCKGRQKTAGGYIWKFKN
jgi:hypothetical protein